MVEDHKNPLFRDERVSLLSETSLENKPKVDKQSEGVKVQSQRTIVKGLFDKRELRK